MITGEEAVMCVNIISRLGIFSKGFFMNAKTKLVQQTLETQGQSDIGPVNHVDVTQAAEVAAQSSQIAKDDLKSMITVAPEVLDNLMKQIEAFLVMDESVGLKEAVDIISNSQGLNGIKGLDSFKSLKTQLDLINNQDIGNETNSETTNVQNVLNLESANAEQSIQSSQIVRDTLNKNEEVKQESDQDTIVDNTPPIPNEDGGSSNNGNSVNLGVDVDTTTVNVEVINNITNTFVDIDINSISDITSNVLSLSSTLQSLLLNDVGNLNGIAEDLSQSTGSITENLGDVLENNLDDTGDVVADRSRIR